MDESNLRFGDAACDELGAYIVVDIEAAGVGGGDVRKKELSQAVLARALPSVENVLCCMIGLGAWGVRGCRVY